MSCATRLYLHKGLGAGPSLVAPDIRALRPAHPYSVMALPLRWHAVSAAIQLHGAPLGVHIA